MPCDFRHEEEARAAGFGCIVGVDEAGRGPLAGPVVAGAVVLPAGFSHCVLNDSKMLSARKREELYVEITERHDILFASAAVAADEIDRVNILRATHLAMERAVQALAIVPDLALIDGRPVKDFPLPQKAIVKGDAASYSIAAASIIAKVERDRLMLAYAERWPEYGFDAHKGYGTKRHLEALQRHGPCPIHRQTFQPVAEAASRTLG